LSAINLAVKKMWADNSILNDVVSKIWLLVFYGLAIISFPQATLAGEDNPEKIPDRYGLSVNIGNTYDPSGDTGFVLLTGFALFDYDKIWPHAAPEALRFKVEASAGSTWTKDKDFMASASIFALYYLDRLAKGSLRPYVEGGIGGIYTEWKADGQGSHLNFNPQLGIGTEFTAGPAATYLVALRLHHISNAGLKEDNRGANSIVFVIGRFF
jgi:lipid A 3-O-deacylase